MSAIVISAVLIGVFTAGIAISRWKRDRAKRLYERIEWWRKTLGAVIAILLVATFIQSGNPILYLAAIVLTALAALWVAVERPDKEVV